MLSSFVTNDAVEQRFQTDYELHSNYCSHQDEACAQILKGYLSVLMVDRQTSMMADYVATLPSVSARVHWYSAFLAGELVVFESLLPPPTLTPHVTTRMGRALAGALTYHADCDNPVLIPFV